MPQQVSFSEDLAAVLQMAPQRLEVIRTLLSKKRSRPAVVKSEVPLSFLRMFYLNHRLKTDGAVKPEIGRVLEPLAKWFERHFPTLNSEPGYAVFNKIGQESMGEFDVDLSGGAREQRLADQRTINTYIAEPYLAGPSTLPSIRVFFKHDQIMLLDSSGDWDDWLYVVKCVTNSLADQAGSIKDLKVAQRAIPWKKVELHLRATKKALRSFESEISSYKPGKANAKPKPKKSKTRK